MDTVLEINWREVVKYLDDFPDNEYNYTDPLGRNGCGCLMRSFFNYKLKHEHPLLKIDYSGMVCFDENYVILARIVDAPIRYIGEIHIGNNTVKDLRKAAKAAWVKTH